MNAGVELRLARVKRGLSREDLSARTKISPAMLEAIEDARFERLPAEIYLRGFLRSYASEVGLTPGALIERYLAAQESATRALTAFDSEATVLESVVALRPQAAIESDDFCSESATSSVAPTPAAVPTRGATGRALGRIVALAASLVIVVAAVAVIRSIGAAPQPVTLAAMPAAAPTAVPPDVVVARAALNAPAVLHGGVPAAPVLSSVSPPLGADRLAPVVDAGAAHLSGEWILTNEVQVTSYKAFEGLQL